MDGLVATEFDADQYIHLTPTGVQVLKDMPYDVWHASMGALLEMHGALPWIIGDMLALGERRYGETYAAAVEMSGRSYYTVAQYKRVAEAVPYEQRTAGVPWTVYQLTAHLDAGARDGYVAAYMSGDIENTDDLRDALRLAGDSKPRGEQVMLNPPVPDAPGVEEQEPAEADPAPGERTPLYVPVGEDIIDPGGRQVAPLQVVDVAPDCPLCGGELGKTACRGCGASLRELASAYWNLIGEMRGFFQDGEIGPTIKVLRE